MAEKDDVDFFQGRDGGLGCAQCRALLSEFVDEELPAEEYAAVKKHLENCTLCASESTQLNNLKKMTAAWEGVSDTESFHQRAVEQMVRESQQLSGTDVAAAAADRHVPGAEAANKEEKPPLLLMAAAVLLAVAAYFLIRWLRGG